MAKIKPRWIDEETAARNARLVLPAMAEQFFQQGRKAAQSKASEKDLHQFRLQVKRFRYTLELFRPCYGPGLKQRIDALKQIQDYLGASNDCATTMQMLQELPVQKALEKKPLQAFLTQRAAEQRSEFIRYWKESFDTAGKLRWWTDYLKRFASARKVKK